eukprot:gene15637-18578_t
MATGPLNSSVHDAVTLAARYNDAHLLKFLYDNGIGKVGSFLEITAAACNNGNREILEFVIKSKQAIGAYINLSSKSLPFLEWIYPMYAKEIGTYKYQRIQDAIAKKSLPLVKFHMASPPTKDNQGDIRYHISQAAEHGCVDILEFFLAGQKPKAWDGITLVKAAKGGHFKIVQILHDCGGPDNWPTHSIENVMDEAAAGGYIGIVRYLDQHGYPATSLAMDGAARGGHLSTVSYLHFQRTEGCTENALKWAASGGHYHVVEFLLDNRTDCDMTAALVGASRNIDIVLLLLDRGALVTQGARNHAAMYACLEVLSLLYWPEYPAAKDSIHELYRCGLGLAADYIAAGQPGLFSTEIRELYLLVSSLRDNYSQRITHQLTNARKIDGANIVYALLVGGHMQAYRYALKHRPFYFDLTDLSLRICRLLKGGDTMDHVLAPLLDAIAVADITEHEQHTFITQAAKQNHPILVRALISKGAKILKSDVSKLVRGGVVDIVKILVEEKYYIPKSAILEATISNQIQVIKLLFPLQPHSTQLSIQTLAQRHNNYHLRDYINDYNQQHQQ